MTDGMTIHYVESTTVDEQIRASFAKTAPATPSEHTYLSRLSRELLTRWEANALTADDLRAIADLADTEWNDIDQRYAHLGLTAAEGYESTYQKRLRSDAATFRNLADKKDATGA
ncbi:hypothetical protein [Curtobacterium sp. MCSS17_016]|uniref:hypothetical protein n=1 Tax=Curtobacterium sp. MCSS17_016 TaxID=2175644 RepID=UPI000DB5D89C|nr:hypothetical protein [Curtobacterium sp. MCSS17_016]WIE81030.1 hypothetical protein DEJ19_021170 [Curtobacterium sp. MCSS17_016]